MDEKTEVQGRVMSLVEPHNLRIKNKGLLPSWPKAEPTPHVRPVKLHESSNSAELN